MRKMTVVEREQLDPDDPEHKTLRITFEGENAPEVYPNDALAVRWHNGPQLVEPVLSQLGERPSRQVRIATSSNEVFPGRIITTSLGEALRDHVEVQVASDAVLKRHNLHDVVSHNSSHTERYSAFARQARLADPPGNEEFSGDYRHVSLSSLLAQAGTAEHDSDVGTLLAQQDRIFLRPYTMSEFRRLSDGRFRASITVSVINKTLITPHGEQIPARGRATSYLESLRPGDTASGYLLPDMQQFPQSLGRTDVPLIAVCTGAGIAGLMSLLRAGYRGGPLWVMYGVRSWERNHLYGPELERLLGEGVIERLDIAESRPVGSATAKRRVTDIVNEQSDRLISWLQRGAHVYLGGRLSMGVSVNRTIRDALVDHRMCGNRSAADALMRQWYEGLRFQASVSRV
ncbi:MAG: hypothetical protein ACLFM0_09280 [Spirochaetales bacterium]